MPCQRGLCGQGAGGLGTPAWDLPTPCYSFKPFKIPQNHEALRSLHGQESWAVTSGHKAPRPGATGVPPCVQQGPRQAPKLPSTSQLGTSAGFRSLREFTTFMRIYF